MRAPFLCAVWQNQDRGLGYVSQAVGTHGIDDVSDAGAPCVMAAPRTYGIGYSEARRASASTRASDQQPNPLASTAPCSVRKRHSPSVAPRTCMRRANAQMCCPDPVGRRNCGVPTTACGDGCGPSCRDETARRHTKYSSLETVGLTSWISCRSADRIPSTQCEKIMAWPTDLYTEWRFTTSASPTAHASLITDDYTWLGPA